MDDSLKRFGNTQSGIGGESEGGSSRMYGQSSREIIKRTYREEDTGSGKRFQRG